MLPRIQSEIDGSVNDEWFENSKDGWICAWDRFNQINVIAGDTITRDSRTYTARKVCLHRIGSTVVVKVVILA